MHFPQRSAKTASSLEALSAFTPCSVYSTKRVYEQDMSSLMIHQFFVIIILFRVSSALPVPEIDMFIYSSSMEVIESTLAAGAKPFQIRQSNCDVPKHFTPLRMAGDYLGAITLILLTGILAGLTLAVMSVDLARLVVWTKTGKERQRFVL